MSAEFKMDTLEATWDRPELFAERETQPENLVTPEQLELLRPIEAALELLRRHRIETKDLDEDETIKKQIWPTSYYLIKDENQIPQLFEASLTETSQQDSLFALSNTEDPELRHMLIDQLGLKTAFDGSKKRFASEKAVTSLIEYGVAIIEEQTSEQQRMTILTLQENGHDVSVVEIPHISFSADKSTDFEDQQNPEKEFNKEQTFVPIDKVEVSDTDTTIGKKYITKMQLVRTETGFQFYINGQPHPGIRQEDPSIQQAIQQLLSAGSAQDSIEEKGYLTEMEYTCDGDPNTLEIGGSIDVTLISESNPIEQKKVEIFYDDTDEDHFTPTENNQVDHDVLLNISATETAKDTNSLFEDWFSATEWIAEITNGQEIVDSTSYTIQEDESHIDPNPNSDLVFTASVTSQLKQPEKVLLSSRYIASKKSTPVLGHNPDQVNLPLKSSLDITLPIILQTEKQSEFEMPTNPSKILATIDNPINLLPLFEILKSTDVIKYPVPVISENRTPQSTKHIFADTFVGPKDNTQPVLVLTQHSKKSKPRDLDTMKLTLPTTVKEAIRIKESVQVKLQKTIQFEGVQEAKATHEATRIIQNTTTKTSSRQNGVTDTAQSQRAKTTLRIEQVTNKLQSKKESINNKIDHLVAKVANSQNITINRTPYQQRVSTIKHSVVKTRPQSKSLKTKKITTEKYQAMMLPTNNKETARSVMTSVLERLRKQSEYEGTDLRLSMDSYGNAEILPEQIHQLSLLTDKIANLAKTLSIKIHASISKRSVAFTPTTTDPIDRVKIAKSLSLPPYSLTIQPDLSCSYLLRNEQ